MSIYGVGNDLVDVKRIERKINNNPAFVKKVFSDEEIAYCKGKSKYTEHFAARFAAKEAFFKALGVGWVGQCEIFDVVVLNDDKGKPYFSLKASAKNMINDLGITHCHLSLSHLSNIAMATVVLEREDKK